MEEILHQLIDILSRYLQGFIHPWWLFGISSINSITMEPMIDPRFRKGKFSEKLSNSQSPFFQLLKVSQIYRYEGRHFFQDEGTTFSFRWDIYSSVKVDF